MDFPVDTKNSCAVRKFVQDKYARMFSAADQGWIESVFHETTSLFTGGHPDYIPLQLRYHNFEHTLQATVCLVLILEGRERSGALPPLTARQFELAVAAVMLHDCGYVRLRSDHQGTGAKYTFIHEMRSAAFAASYLPSIGAKLAEAEDVARIIQCTGPNSKISEIHFRDQHVRMLGCAVATADFVAQMAAPDYLEKLAYLYLEFVEAYDFFGMREEERFFKSLEDLLQKTPDFWSKFVLPRLDKEFDGVFRYLETPGSGSANLFYEAIEANIAEIKLANEARSRPTAMGLQTNASMSG